MQAAGAETTDVDSAGALLRRALVNGAQALIPKFISTNWLAWEIIAIALEHCDGTAAVLAGHDRWMAHYLTPKAARRRAAACGTFVAYVRVLDRHGLRARTLLPGIKSWTESLPEFVGTDMAGHLRMYDQDRVESVVGRTGHWGKSEPDGGAAFRWFGAIFFDNRNHPGVEDAFYGVLSRIDVPIQRRLLSPFWVG